ncbi:MAG: DUF4346 domain-containing protein, partial [Nitrososphaerales archaeon]
EAALANQIEGWLYQMEPVQYACLGCDHCYAGAATNSFSQAFPDVPDAFSLTCAFEVKPGRWPIVPGEYALLDADFGPIAVSTLASLELPDHIAAMHPAGLAIVGKTETENIGLDKVVKNVVANQALRCLIVAGKEAEGHYPGQTLLALSQNGVDEKLRVIGSRGKRPVLRNVSREEIEAFRQQVLVVDMIGCEDASAIAAKVAELAGALDDGCADASCACHGGHLVEQPVSIALVAAPQAGSCGCAGSCEDVGRTSATGVPVIQAHAPSNLQLDKAGYFVVIVQRERGVIVTEHYDYDNTLSGVIEGRDARSIYWTAIENAWVSELSHAAYLGKELAKAELALQTGGRYVQDGA